MAVMLTRLALSGTLLEIPTDDRLLFEQWTVCFSDNKDRNAWNSAT
jgi:hypothetical protein